MAALLWGALLLAPLLTSAQSNVISEIIPHGNRGIPTERIRQIMGIQAGEVYDQAALDRAFNALWNSGSFEDIRFEREDTTKGILLHVYVTEKPKVNDINYPGLNAVSKSDVLDRFKERKIGLTKESLYDPTKVIAAKVALQELLAEHGHQFATIKPEIHPIPPSRVDIDFVVKEGPKVKVGKIRFEGNQHVSSNYLRASMVHSRPIGIPHSKILEDIFSKTFDATKLSEDAERVRDAYQQKGYFKATVLEPQTKIRDIHRGAIHVPLLQKTEGKVVDITVPVDEGAQYRIAKITFSGNKAIANTATLRAQFPFQDGDLFNSALVRKGLENLHKLYGAGGYINFTPVPNVIVDEDKKTVTMEVDIDEGKQFYVRRIEFTGNSTTRDKVIRRELAVEEGQIYNEKLWEFSLQRLNQLQYFEPLKIEKDSEIKTNNQEGTVDITLKVKEKGKNSIGLSGGLSGYSGASIGVNYETNNLMGLGENLRVSVSYGNIERDEVLSFTQPYAFDRPLALGFSVFNSKYDYNAAKNYASLTGSTLNLPQDILNTLQNFSQSRTGFSLTSSYPLRSRTRQERVGLTYSWDTSSLTTFNTATQSYFQLLAFRSGISGPNALSGIITSKLVPSFTINKLNYLGRNNFSPTNGYSLFLGGDVAGLGGNVRMVRPVIEFKKFHPLKNKTVIGFHVQGSFITGYGGVVAPPFERFYMGGDTDIRGFDIRSITPYAFITNVVNIPLQNPSGAAVPYAPARGGLGGNVIIPLALPQIVFTGGDTSIVTNLEYRIPIAGPVGIAIFSDAGMNMVLRKSELQLSSSQLTNLGGSFGCSSYTPGIVNSCASQPLSPSALQAATKLTPIPGTNYVPRVSTGLEFQVVLPVVNAPFRIYWAYNPMRLDTLVNTQAVINRDMFPTGGAGDFTYQQALQAYGTAFRLREPRKTFRFSVATTF